MTNLSTAFLKKIIFLNHFIIFNTKFPLEVDKIKEKKSAMKAELSDNPHSGLRYLQAQNITNASHWALKSPKT